ncbi:MAG: photosystem II stability/assembly factor-like uncharacterized protein [Saprospiraceae bacterium]|jgi:photosystem II stability/assembly factor-like uncharacterized protein
MLNKIALLVCYLFSISLIAQNPPPPSTSAETRLKGFEQRKTLLEQSIVKNVAFESVGPTVFSGRVVDVAVNPKDPSIFYVAYASGGLWYTASNGTRFTPVFDQEAVMTIGNIAVDWERNIIWVGTGESNSSRSSYAGLGMYTSKDGGKTWEHKGLVETHHIGRIILHPDDPNTLWVAALGHLYSPNNERGLYKTTDGGTTWQQVLFANENAGAIDLIIDPENPSTLYAATWEKTRRAWNFVEAGSGSGIYKSTNGGDSWALISMGTNGFPTGNDVGRIGLSMYKKNGETVLYALLDNYSRRPKEAKDDAKDDLNKDRLRSMTAANFLKLEKKKVADYLESNSFPEKYTAEKVIKMVENGKILPEALVEYLEDANSLLFDTPVVGAEVYRSDNEGATWYKTHEGYLDNLYNSYGYYFGTIRVSPHNPDKIYIAGVPVLRSEDGGKTFKNINGDNVHVDHHALWLNPNRDKHMILGNDGGTVISYDDGESWIRCSTPAVGQFYTVVLDDAKPYNIYGGLQDNGVWVGSSNYKASDAWQQRGQYPYQSIMGGDGMQVAIDSRNRNIVYTGFQFGNYFRLNRATEDRKYITPKQELGARPYRWNWQAPIHLSVHNQDILYMGANKLLRSFNQGDDFEEISADLTSGGIKGDIAYATLTSIHESPLKFGLLYVGTDDGFIHVTPDGGNTWVRISDKLPKKMWVTKVQASQHEKSRVFASLNGYRWDDFNAYAYMSDDYGNTWTTIGTDLPNEPVNVIKEDPKNPDILYVGTDHGAYVSLDRGKSFLAMQGGLPAVAVHDLAIHPKANDLVLGTHGRSFWKANVNELQQLNKEVLAKTIHPFSIDKKRYSSRWGSIRNQYTKAFEPAINIPFYTSSPGNMAIAIKTDKGDILKQLTHKADQGLNYLKYDLSIEKSSSEIYQQYLNTDLKEGDSPIELKDADNGTRYLQAGKYIVELSKDGEVEKVDLEIVKK